MTTSDIALALYAPPFHYKNGYVYDADGHMVADDPAQGNATARVRGWGRINGQLRLPSAEAVQDAVGEHIAAALTAYWNLKQGVLMPPRTLDPCCGSCMMHFNKKNPDVFFGDKRRETHILCDGRILKIEPDALMDFTNLPFADGTFKLIAFDPPHLKHAGEKSWLRAKYGVLSTDWREDIRKGFSECFRVLASDGVLVFKWAEDQVKLKEVLALTPHQPIFGHPTGRKGLTHWMTFMKPRTAL